MSYKDTEILRIKDIMSILKCGKTTAYKIRKDIAKDFKIKVITYNHLKKYLKIDN